MKKTITFLLLVGFISGSFISRDHSRGAQKVNNYMRAKLDHSQKILEGLALEDYKAIANSAQQLSLLSQGVSWQILQTPEYRRHSNEFRRSANTLTKSAKQKNLDGAALAYFDVTLKCINCHKYVREVQMAQLKTHPQTSLLSLNAELESIRPLK